MSVDLNFWRYKEGAARDHRRVYRLACCEGEALEELETLPVEDILGKLAAAFGDWTALGGGHYEREGRGAFSVSTTAQTVRFDCYGMGEADMNALMDVPMAFGCPLYDPQIDERFDGWTDH